MKTEEVEAVSFPHTLTLETIDFARLSARTLVRNDKAKKNIAVKSVGEYTNGVRLAIDWFLGSNHVTSGERGLLQRHYVSPEEMKVARTAVLNALALNKVLGQLPRRIAERLLTTEEVEAGKVEFVSAGTGNRRRLEFALA